uniref:EOG090X07YX n=1 Tax=Moina brachiata TaxID=675436 RepID=A0A4Y7NIL8_9CRUS|nr:EOG090X07YX [Moina brachiata]SVE93071.1 EOG090X07YX [Moina brachiata]
MAKKTGGRNNTLTNGLNFRPQAELNKTEKKGTKPLPEPSTIPHVLLLLIVHLCKKVLYVDTNIKVGIYIMFVFFGSILGDVLPIPNTYFSRKGNFFNVYFVKLSWGWTMASVGLFVWLTSTVYSCADKIKIRRQMLRLIIATIIWYVCTSTINIVEESYGYCSKSAHVTKKQCLAKGLSWYGFSISGHAFILIYCTLIIMEEAKALIGWEGIKDHLRNEEHNRTAIDAGVQTPLDSLTNEQLTILKEKYEKYTPYIRLSFISMTLLTIIWDVMLVATVLYFHSTPEKFAASVIAVVIWFFTYRFVYHRRILGIPLPGEGSFQYMQSAYTGRRSSLILGKNEKIQTFLGMPLNFPKSPQSVAEQGSAKTSEKASR